MIENVIARRYARALAEAAAEKNELERTNADINRVADILDPERGDISVPELLEVLGSPTVATEEKIRVTDTICQKLQISQLVSDFLNVLIRRGRVTLAGRIAREYVRIATEIERISTAEVETALPLSGSEEERLRQSLEKATGKKVRVQSRVNRKLLAGVRVKMGDLMFEGSLKGRFERLSRELE